MTQEEKAKAYDEALERIRKELQACNYTGCDTARQIFRFFPELAEREDELTWLTKYIEEEAYNLSIDIRDDEDEKIRRALIRFHKSTIDIDGVKGSEIVSWLEKQASKTKWSEEDDYNVQCCIAKAERDIANGYHGRNKELIEWLKSIKDRVK